MPHQIIHDLDTLMGGAVAEKMRTALAEVFQNIYDPNTDPTAKREVTLTLSVKPNTSRDVANMTVQAKTKLAPAHPADGTVYLHRSDNGTITATEKLAQVPGQIDMAGEETLLPNVITFENVR